MSGMGWIECCGHRVPVTSIHMEPGAFVITGTTRGPVRAFSGPSAVFCADGNIFADGPWLTCDASRRCDVVQLVIRCSFSPGDIRPVVAGEVEGSSVPALAAAPRALTAG